MSLHVGYEQIKVLKNAAYLFLFQGRFVYMNKQ